jgi:hypothetical protein
MPPPDQSAAMIRSNETGNSASSIRKEVYAVYVDERDKDDIAGSEPAHRS